MTRQECWQDLKDIGCTPDDIYYRRPGDDSYTCLGKGPALTRGGTQDPIEVAADEYGVLWCDARVCK